MTLAICDIFILWSEFHNLHHLYKHSRKQLFVQAHKFVGQFTYGASFNDNLLMLRAHSGSSLWPPLSPELSCAGAGGLRL